MPCMPNQTSQRPQCLSLNHINQAASAAIKEEIIEAEDLTETTIKFVQIKEITSLIIIWHYTSANSALHATIQRHFRALKQNTQRYGTNNAYSFKSTTILLVRSSPACCLHQESSSTFSPQLQYSILIMARSVDHSDQSHSSIRLHCIC